MQQNYGVHKLEFKDVVLEHIKRVLEIGSHELRDTTRQVISSNQTQTIEQEDTRYSYIQAVENLSYILTGYFDDKIKNLYDECIKVIQGFDYEVYEYCKEEYDKVCKDLGKKNLGSGFVIEMKLKKAKILFIALNMLLKRNDYLKSAVYGEGIEDEVVSGEDEDEEEEEEK